MFDRNILTIIYSDAQDLRFVYDWRQEQERTLKATKGTGMTEEQVNNFVDGCQYPHTNIFDLFVLTRLTDYPSYELFTDTLRNGVFKPAHESSANPADWQGRQLRLVVDRNRKVQEVIKI